MGKLELYYSTIKYLHIGQVLHQCLNRMRKLLRRKYDFSLYKQGHSLKLVAPIEKYESCHGEEFTFLNVRACFNGEWEYKQLGPLWSFNINYMEYLLQPSMSFENGIQWIMRYIASQDRNTLGMSPYCIALRSVNWIKFITKNRELFVPEDLKKIDTSLYSQCRILQNNLEYHLAGNHLLEDFFSLLWGGFYFNDKNMYNIAAEGLWEQLKEQTLADGANFEQSPMYHSIILDRVLDAVNLLQNNFKFAGQKALCQFLNDKASMMLEWLQSISYSDGTFPLFNDSAEGIAPTVMQLYDYATRLNVAWGQGSSSASGYYCVDYDKFELRIDVGGIAASYIPGHSHADTFNFELRTAGFPFIVDSGISTYQCGDRRQYERSTAAHNTVTVYDDSSSRVWAAFRCAQRAKVINSKIDPCSICATHDGFLKYGTFHTRKFSWSKDRIEISDFLSGDVCGKAYLHFAPELDVCLKEDRIFAPFAEIILQGSSDVKLFEGEVARQYNKLEKCKILCVSFRGALKCEISIR